MSMKSRYLLASRLAQFLRLNGDKVIDGSCKLSLTTSALCLVNSLFVDVLTLNNDQRHFLQDVSMEEMLTDVQYLSDFIKKTTSLKLFHAMQTLRGGVDLSYFSNLVVLELRRIPTHLIIGLGSLSQQLKVLICTRSIYLLKELFGCYSDEEDVTEWTQLNELNLAYNYLEGLDNSLKCFPNLQVLDLSHNSMKHVDEIQVLNQLVQVNLSFNQLDHLPYFNAMSCRSLKKLYLRNNNLEDLKGLECIFCLEELDLSFNCLSEFHILNPLEKLKNLNMVKLEGNPLAFHRCHRELIARYLHPNVLNKGIILDTQLLVSHIKLVSNPTPLRNVICKESSSRHQMAINMVVEDIHNAIQLPNEESKSNIDEDFDEKIIASDNLTPRKSSIKLKSSIHRKKSKMREVLINEPPVENNDEFMFANDKENMLKSHLEAKLDVEARRRKHGETWLIPESSVINIQMPKVPDNTPVVSCHENQPIHKLTSSPKLENVCLNPILIPQKETITPSLDNNDPRGGENEESVIDNLVVEVSGNNTVERHSSKSSDDIEVLIPLDNRAFELDFKEKELDSSDRCNVDIYENSLSQFSSEEELSKGEESEEESESQIFIVSRRINSGIQSLFVNIGPKYIKEKHHLTTKVLEKLDLTRLTSAEIINQSEDVTKCEVHLVFDTAKPSNKQRIYVPENAEAARSMVSILQPFADARILEEMTIGAYECMKCNSQFSKDNACAQVVKTKTSRPGEEYLSSSYDSLKDDLKVADVCPNCGSQVVVEMETMPMPAFSVKRTALTNIPVRSKPIESTQENASFDSSSSGSFLSALFSSIKKSPLPTRKSDSSSSNIFPDTSQLSDKTGCLTEKKCVAPHTKSEFSHPDMRRNSSDITVISNPSQSSIAAISEYGVESELNTIIEKSSQYSLSPPPSEINTIFQPEKSIYDTNTSFTNIKQKQDSLNGNIPPYNNNNQNTFIHPERDSGSLNDSFEQSTEDYMSDCACASLHQPQVLLSENPVCGNSEDNLDESIKLFNLLSQTDVITRNTFTQLDHRMKLYLEIDILKEDLDICLEGAIIPLSTGEEFKGIFVLSFANVYIIKISGINSEDFKLTIIHTSPLHQMKDIQMIFGNQGFSLSCGSRNLVFTVLIRDMDLCNSFVALLLEIIQSQTSDEPRMNNTPSSSQLKQIKEELIEAYHPDISENDEPVILLHIFGFWKDLNNRDDPKCPICIIVTPTEIFASKIFYKKQDSSKNWQKKPLFQYSPVSCQKISDLLSLTLKYNLTDVKLSFHDEENGNESLWLIYTQTKSSLFSFINSLKKPWENVFGISLPLALNNS